MLLCPKAGTVGIWIFRLVLVNSQFVSGKHDQFLSPIPGYVSDIQPVSAFFEASVVHPTIFIQIRNDDAAGTIFVALDRRDFKFYDERVAWVRWDGRRSIELATENQPEKANYQKAHLKLQTLQARRFSPSFRNLTAKELRLFAITSSIHLA